MAILGGGISGLSAAHRLTELRPDWSVTLFEASERLGGILGTERRDGFLIERAADMFTTREPWAVQLCERIGFADRLIGTNDRRRRAFVVRRGRLVPVPAGFTLMAPMRAWPIVTTPILSWWGKLRLAGEYFVPRKRDESDESLASFVRRRLGREAFDRLVQPLIGGIYTADPERLSMQATMQQFLDMERQHGGLIRATLRSPKSPSESQGSGARYGLFVAPRDGMSSFIEAISARLPAGIVHLNAPVREVARNEAAWQVRLSDGHAESFDDLIVALPAPIAATLLANIAPSLAEELRTIEYASAAVVVLAYDQSQFAHPCDGFGFVVPQVERRRILAGSFASVKFAGRAPDGSLLIRVFLGGACDEARAELPDEDLLAIVREELAELLGARGEPRFHQIVRWRRSMPQYHVGHLDRVARIERIAADLPRFCLAGNAYRGVGIPYCVRSGEEAAERLVSPGLQSWASTCRP